MAWDWRDVPRLLASPNRAEAISRAWNAWSWKPVYPLAGLYRRSLGRGTKVVAVVGSAGKTNTVYVLDKVLGTDDGGRVNRNFGMHLVRKLMTSGPRQKVLPMEVGISRTGQMARYAWMLKPDIVVVTTVGSDHHPSLGGREGIFQEKSLMVKALAPDGLAVLNGDDPRVRAMADLTSAEVLFYGLGCQNQVRAEDLSFDGPQGSSFILVAPGVRQRIRLPLLGDHMVLCALACCAVALRLGVEVEDIAAALQGLRPLQGRMHPVWLPNGVCLIEDHGKGTAETFKAALDFMAKVPAQRKIVVLGRVSTPLGSRYKLSKELGAQAGRSADMLLTMGSSYKGLAAGARQAGMPNDKIINCKGEVHSVAGELRGILKPGDLVLLKGRLGQHLGRITLLLQGKEVSCSTKHCEWTTLSCDRCRLLNKPQAE
ncbi:MAG: hypothetical protein KQI62_00035 [Deltaproteobacteria bacterium]|nr:hypothetical protein [Deltaproteobacteria bacterium]